MNKNELVIVLLGVIGLFLLDHLISHFLFKEKTIQKEVVLRVIQEHKKQPVLLSNKVNHLEQLDFEQIVRKMNEIEASNTHNKINRCGFIGAFQVGVAVLEDSGLVKKGEFKRMKRMNIRQKDFVLNHLQWKNGYYIYTFLNDFNLQKKVFISLCKRNYKILKRGGYISDTDDINYVRGAIFASHLIGVGATKRFLSGKKGNYTDANNVSALTYFRIGYYLNQKISKSIRFSQL